jgi:hypothetical protein
VASGSCLSLWRWCGRCIQSCANYAFIGRWVENLLGYSSFITVFGGDLGKWDWRFRRLYRINDFFSSPRVCFYFGNFFPSRGKQIVSMDDNEQKMRMV